MLKPVHKLEDFKPDMPVKVIGNSFHYHNFPIGTEGKVHYVTAVDVAVIKDNTINWVLPEDLKPLDGTITGK